MVTAQLSTPQAVYLTECVMAWLAQLHLAQEKAYSESHCVEPAHQEMWNLFPRVPFAAHLAELGGSGCGLSLGKVGQHG